MKISRWNSVPFLIRGDEKIEPLFEAKIPDREDGVYFSGVGTTVQKAVAEARHEYRTWHGGPVEHGQCRQGRFHK